MNLRKFEPTSVRICPHKIREIEDNAPRLNLLLFRDHAVPELPGRHTALLAFDAEVLIRPHVHTLTLPDLR